MSDLIDRQAAIDAICEHGTDLERRGITVLAVANHKQATVDLLENLPPVQPEYTEQDVRDSFNSGYTCGMEAAQSEIIRCRDCRYGVDYYHDGNCYCAKPGCELLYFDGSWDFYCANAERRE